MTGDYTVRSRANERNGFLVTEMVVGMAILGILIFGLTLSLKVFADFNSYQMVRQRCVSAGQAELDSIAATGKEIAAEDFERLWPELEATVEQRAGAGQWDGLRLVSVTVAGKSARKEVQIQLSRYVVAKGQL